MTLARVHQFWKILGGMRPGHYLVSGGIWKHTGATQEAPRRHPIVTQDFLLMLAQHCPLQAEAHIIVKYQ